MKKIIKLFMVMVVMVLIIYMIFAGVFNLRTPVWVDKFIDYFMDTDW